MSISLPQRLEYNRSVLLETDLPSDPLALFRAWFDAAVADGLAEPHAMTLATADASGRPSARVVLLKTVDDRGGFCFFTNYQSRKGRDLEANPQAALVFHWHAVERQVRVEGRVERTSEEQSDAYFHSRPVSARLGAWASEQSQAINGREPLEQRLAELERLHPDGEVPRPPHWGGYRVVPHAIEFWQGRLSRLHDRFLYTRGEAGWTRQRLSP